ncbi:uncharacterized protein [Typha latifolia]|uniref:uncharacterized protein isoform X1 n=2 Tax=Typha latifolia TaxID=4733 RepID=UPI003C30DC0D
MLSAGEASPAAATGLLQEEYPPSPSSEGGEAGWLSGLISGAGRIISSVFGSDSTSSSSSSSFYSSDEDIDRYKDENTAVSSERHDEINLGAQETKLLKDSMEGSLAIVSEIESKDAIQQLLMQETYSRDECNKLVQLIQSRVVDSGPMELGQGQVEKELSITATGIDTTLPVDWQNRKVLEKVSLPSCRPNILSPGPSYLALSPDVQDTAVMEAKKWLETKKLTSSSKFCSDCGPCSLNSDVFNSDFECQASSPAEIAKSYMQSVPPVQSPSLSSARYKSPTGVPLQKDEAANACYLVPPSKVLNRNYHRSVSGDVFDNSQRIQTKSTGSFLNISKIKQANLSREFTGHEASRTLSTADQGVIEAIGMNDAPNFLPSLKGRDTSVSLSEGLHAKDHGAVESFTLFCQRAYDEILPLGTARTTSTDIISDSEAVINAALSNHETPILTALPLVPRLSQIGDYPAFCDSASLLLDRNQDTKQLPPVIGQVENASFDSDSLAMVPKEEHDAGSVPKDSRSAPKIMIKEGVTIALSSPAILYSRKSASLKRNMKSTTCKEEPDMGISKRARRTPGQPTAKVPRRRTKSTGDKLEDGTLANSSSTQGRKATSRTGRGRGKSS